MSLQHWRGWLIAGVIFALGVAIGTAGTTWWGVRQLRRTLQTSAETSGRADRNAARIGAQLTKELVLTEAEAMRVQQILSESAAAMKGIRVKAAQEVGRELRATTRRLAAALPAEKRPDLYRIIARRYLRLGLTPPAPEAGSAP